jgi:hypothetical protein
VAWACLLSSVGVVGQTPEAMFTIGVLPNVSARVILTNYEPMRDYFARELQRRVEIATAPDFKAFSESTLRGAYHMVVTAANVGRVAQLDAKWAHLAIYEPSIAAVMVAPPTCQLLPDQLGQVSRPGNPQSLVACGLARLREQGCRVARTFSSSTPRMTTAWAPSFAPETRPGDDEPGRVPGETEMCATPCGSSPNAQVPGFLDG